MVPTGCNHDHVALKLSSDCKNEYHLQFLFSSAFTCNLDTRLVPRTFYHFANDNLIITHMDAIPNPDKMSFQDLRKFCETPLQAAAYEGDTKHVQELIDAGADLNAVSGFFGTALQAACYCGQYHASELLLEAGADANSASGFYGYPVQAAAYRGHTELILLLYTFRADRNPKGGVYGNALVAAAKGGHEFAVKTLLCEGADYNAEGTKDYPTAVYAASLHGHREVVAWLLRWGADPNKEFEHDKSAPRAAIERCDEDIVTMLIKYGASLDQKCHSGLNVGELALHMAIKHGYTDLVRSLLTFPKIDANLPNEEGLSPLLIAVSHGHAGIVKVLLNNFSKKVNSQARDRSGSTALMIAASYGYLDVARVILEHGERKQETHIYGQASLSLMMAVRRGNQGLVLLLLESGAAQRHLHWHDQTPLMTAIEMGHEAITFLLLQHGAKIDATDGSGNKLIDVAVSKGYRTIEKLLKFGEGKKAIADRDRWWKTVSRVRDDWQDIE